MGFTIRDIAAVCGVNPSTVSRALRDDPRVKSETREKIIAMAREHGYNPNIVARNLAAGKTNTVWFFLGSLENEIERKPALQISSMIQEAGYDLMLVLHRGQPDLFLRLFRKLTQKVTDGAIIIPCGDFDIAEMKKLMPSISVPIIFIDRWLDDLNCPVVTSDNRFAARTLTEKCLDAGAEIFYVYFKESDNVARQRKDSVCSVLAARNVEFYVDEDSLQEALKRNPEKSLAVLGNSGRELSSIIKARFSNYIGERHIIGGFFDFWDQPSKDFFQRIFVCCQDFNSIARHASQLIVKMLSGDHVCPDTFIEVSPERFKEI